MCQPHCSTCRCPSEPPPILIELMSADGLVSPRLIQRPRTEYEYRTVVSPTIRFSVTEPLEPTAPAFQERRYRWNGKTRPDQHTMREVRIFEEEQPPPPKYRVCESPAGKWCNACKTGHSSVAPRVVGGK